MTGETSAETTAEPDGQTGNEPTEERDTAQAADVSASPGESSHVNGQAAAAGDAPAVESVDSAGEEPASAEQEATAPTEATEAPEPAADASAEPAADAAPEPAAVTPDAERPAVGPKILGVAADPKPLPTVKATLPTRKRRRRPSAAERHRRAFFAALTELRRGGPSPSAVAESGPAQEGAQASAAEAAPESAATEEPAATLEGVAEQPTSAPAADEQAAATPDEQAAAAPEEQAAVAPEEPATAAASEEPQAAATADQPSGSAADRSPTSPARVAAAIERVGGAEVIKEALKPKQDEKGQPLKWAAVCAQSAEGMKPGDPIFNAWVRLAATPVREVKSQLPRPEGERSGGREGAGRRPGAQRSGRGGGRRDDRASRAEYASHAQDGTFRKSIRIVTGHDEDQERRERERNRKEQREAKRAAERERLARLGY